MGGAGEISGGGGLVERCALRGIEKWVGGCCSKGKPNEGELFGDGKVVKENPGNGHGVKEVGCQQATREQIGFLG